MYICCLYEIVKKLEKLDLSSTNVLLMDVLIDYEAST